MLEHTVQPKRVDEHAVRVVLFANARKATENAVHGREPVLHEGPNQCNRAKYPKSIALGVEVHAKRCEQDSVRESAHCGRILPHRTGPGLARVYRNARLAAERAR